MPDLTPPAPDPVRRLTRRGLLAGGLAGLAGAAAAACSPRQSHPASAAPPRSPVAAARPTPAPTTPPPNPASVRANEAGMVPVLMHHRVTAHVESEYDMTPEWLRAELTRLRRERYYPVRMTDLARGRLDHVPPGRTPVVLTFDDGTSGQFGYTPDGRVKPDSGVGVLLDFARAHPDFPAVATFYINKDPFNLPDTRKALGDLHRLGFEIGNHTFHHENLGGLGAGQVQQELALLAAMVSSAVPGVVPSTMALPLGVEPHPSLLAARGNAGGTAYRNDAVLLVGANPAPSPFSSSWDPLGVPRVRSSSYQGGKGEFLAGYWLDYLAAHPAERYVSAGNPGKITVPRRLAGQVAPAYHGRLVTY